MTQLAGCFGTDDEYSDDYYIAIPFGSRESAERVVSEAMEILMDMGGEDEESDYDDDIIIEVELDRILSEIPDRRKRLARKPAKKYKVVSVKKGGDNAES